MAREESRGKRPFKIWDSWRNVRKSCVVSSLKDLESRGKEKLQICPSEQVRLVLESDGTQVEDGEYFRTLPNNTIILVLRQGERWYPTGVDAIRTAITAIPKIVCETIHALELQDETPSWKIMDNKGRVTVVLHWDQRGGGGGGGSGPSPSPQPRRQQPPPLLVQTSVDSQGKKETIINDVYPSARYTSSPQITVINHDLDQQRRHHVHLKSGEGGYEECLRAGSPSGGRECDFHCCALHEEGRKIAVHKSVATSPIQDSLSPQHPTRARPQAKAHVRFLDIEGGGASGRMQQTGREESSESETENAAERPPLLLLQPQPHPIHQHPRPWLLLLQPQPQLIHQHPRPQLLLLQPQPHPIHQHPRPWLLLLQPQPQLIHQHPRPQLLLLQPQPHLINQPPRPQLLLLQPQPHLLFLQHYPQSNASPTIAVATTVTKPGLAQKLKSILISSLVISSLLLQRV